MRKLTLKRNVILRLSCSPDSHLRIDSWRHLIPPGGCHIRQTRTYLLNSFMLLSAHSLLLPSRGVDSPPSHFASDGGSSPLPARVSPVLSSRHPLLHFSLAPFCRLHPARPPLHFWLFPTLLAPPLEACWPPPGTGTAAATLKISPVP